MDAHRRHDSVARRAPGDVALNKRQSYSNARFTYYVVGLGACGQTNQPSDFIVALDSSLYGGGSPGPQCFKSITISANGKQTTATIMDECPGCPFGGLDMSEGLFQYFADLGVGVLNGEWWYNDDSGNSKRTDAHQRLDALARRQSGDVTLHRRQSYSSARFTYYSVGL
ncbi:hypothetical protein WOLCODRAFT_65340 [Wolfiporia cocos MD-104 SS10]|uniref:Plant expansin n=1 Tax=Wolfiporia cocos (strain MD-104) TaxID=742152 RepID=A0A2H3JLK8_WOLCO|nr:hypothetical protein WOLCODRAFT_65340 [Wolfiporia cocos MD-104 SS10]